MFGQIVWFGLLVATLIVFTVASTWQVHISPSGVIAEAEVMVSESLQAQASITVSPVVLWPKMGLKWTPPERTATITFTTDSLSCVLIRPGQILREGDLIGYASKAVLERTHELAHKLNDLHDEFLRAEVEAELTRLHKQNEIRALIPGRVLRVAVTQEGQVLRVNAEVSRAP
ncbi:MAG: hypothetical protein ABDI20_04915 [Candidatus Bipolaricaulaceae bacterium]